MWVGDHPVTELILRNSACPQALSLMELCLSGLLSFCNPFLFRVFCITPWITCLGHVHYGIACLASQASYWAGALWDGLSGLYWFPFVRCPSKHIYCKTDHDWLCCNCLDRQLNCWSFAHWLISVTNTIDLMSSLCLKNVYIVMCF